MRWYQPFADLNPDVDLELLKTSDRTTKLKYLYEGEVYLVTPRNLLKRKDINTRPRASPKYCSSDDSFMQWFKKHADLNPGFDPKGVRISALCPISYHVDDSAIDTVIVKSLFRNRKFSPPQRKNFKCWDNKDFRIWFEMNKDLNPDIDPTVLTFRDYKTKLYYRPRDSLDICSITPIGLSRKKDWYEKLHKHDIKHGTAKLATSVPGFLLWFEQYSNLNPGIDLATLSASSKETLNYPARDGTIATISVRALCSRENIFFQPESEQLCMDNMDFLEWFKEYEWLNRDIDISSLTSRTTTVKLQYLYNGKICFITPNRLLKQKNKLFQFKSTIRNDPLFWDYCIEKEIEIVSSYDKKSSLREFKMHCPKGHSFDQTPKLFYSYANKGRDPCPFCDGRIKVIPGVNDAATADPEVALFYSEDNKKPVNTISPLNGNNDFKMECPYCGHKFTRRMKNFVGKHPKCPGCKDKGTGVGKTEANYMPENIPFLILGDEILSFTRKENRTKEGKDDGELQKDCRAPAERHEQA